MAERAALLIAVETYFEAGPLLPYAVADAAELLRALPAAGYNPDKCILIAGHRTTKAVIESHLARLPKLIGKPASLLVLFIGRAFAHRNRGYLACTDTIHADLFTTSVSLAELHAALHKTKVPEISVLLDVDPLAGPGELAPSGLDEGELRKLFDESPTCVALLAAAPGERSYESGQLRRGVWRHHVIEAFTGKARSAVNPNGTATAASLHAYLEAEVPRTLLRTYDPPPEQTPLLFGAANASHVVAEVGSLFVPESDLLDVARMKRVVFRAESAIRVKDLSGFRKSHSVPERANEWARKYVNRIAQPDLKDDLDATFDAIRETFGYKRKELEASAERDGIGFIRTPHFEYTVSVSVAPDDPSGVIWRREVGRFSDPALVHTAEFATVFGSAFDRLAFEFAVPVNVAEFVDRIEDHPLDGVTVMVASDADAAEVQLAGFAGRVTVTANAVEIAGRGGSSAGLLDLFLNFLRKFSGLGEPRALR